MAGGKSEMMVGRNWWVYRRLTSFVQCAFILQSQTPFLRQEISCCDTWLSPW